MAASMMLRQLQSLAMHHMVGMRWGVSGAFVGGRSTRFRKRRLQHEVHEGKREKRYTTSVLTLSRLQVLKNQGSRVPHLSPSP